MPRLDVTRVTLWRTMQALTADVERAIDGDLRTEWDIGLGWFDVLAALQRRGGFARPSELATDLHVVASSLSRRLDRLEEEAWIKRHAGGRSARWGSDTNRYAANDQRTVTVELTRRGRTLWRAMNVTYRRSLQAHFAGGLADRDVANTATVLDAIGSRLAAQLDDDELD